MPRARDAIRSRALLWTLPGCLLLAACNRPNPPGSQTAAILTATPAFAISSFASSSYGFPAGVAIDTGVAPAQLLASDLTGVPRFDLAQAINACGAGVCDTAASGLATSLAASSGAGVAIDSQGIVGVAQPGPLGMTSGAILLFQPGASTSYCKAIDLVSPRGVAFDTVASPNILWVADAGLGAVVAYVGYQSCPSSGTITPSLSIGLTAPGDPPLSAPDGVSIDASEDLWVADTGNNRIVGYPFGGIAASKPTFKTAAWFLGQCSGAGTSPNVLTCGGASITPLGAPTGLAFDPAGDLFVANSQLGVPASSIAPGVVEYTSPQTVGGSAAALFMTGSGGRPIAVAIAEGDLYVADMGLKEVVGFYDCAGMPGTSDNTDLHCLACSSSNGACDTPAPRCLVAATGNRCVPCVSDGDCSGTTPHCSPTSHTCVVCATAGNSQCGGAGMCCDVATNTCTSDTADTFCGASCQDCTATPTTPTCSAGACVCTATSCPAGSLCTGGSCVPCTSNLTCGPTCAMCATGEYCGAAAGSVSCQPCTVAVACGPSYSRCTGSSAPYCVDVSGTYQCVECTTPSQCTASPTLACNGDACTTACTATSQCQTGYACTGSASVPGVCVLPDAGLPDARPADAKASDRPTPADTLRADTLRADLRRIDVSMAPEVRARTEASSSTEAPSTLDASASVERSASTDALAGSDGTVVIGKLGGSGCGCTVGDRAPSSPAGPILLVLLFLFAPFTVARGRRIHADARRQRHGP